MILCNRSSFQVSYLRKRFVLATQCKMLELDLLTLTPRWASGNISLGFLGCMADLLIRCFISCPYLHTCCCCHGMHCFPSGRSAFDAHGHNFLSTLIMILSSEQAWNSLIEDWFNIAERGCSSKRVASYSSCLRPFVSFSRTTKVIKTLKEHYKIVDFFW